MDVVVTYHLEGALSAGQLAAFAGAAGEAGARVFLSAVDADGQRVRTASYDVIVVDGDVDVPALDAA